MFLTHNNISSPTDIYQGLVLYNLFVALALIFNQYVNPVGVTNSKWKCKKQGCNLSSFRKLTSVADYVTYDVWLFVELVVVYFLFVETGGKSLEETAALLDGEAMTEKLQENSKQAAEKITVHVFDEKRRTSQA